MRAEGIQRPKPLNPFRCWARDLGLVSAIPGLEESACWGACLASLAHRKYIPDPKPEILRLRIQEVCWFRGPGFGA